MKDCRWTCHCTAGEEALTPSVNAVSLGIYIYKYTHILCTRLKVPLPCERPCLHFRCTSANHTLQSRESTLALLVSSGGKKARRLCDPLMQKETPAESCIWQIIANNRKWWIKPFQGTHSWHLPVACEACACRTWSFLQLPRLEIYYQPNKCDNSTIFQKCAINRLTHAIPWIPNHLYICSWHSAGNGCCGKQTSRIPILTILAKE